MQCYQKLLYISTVKLYISNTGIAMRKVPECSDIVLWHSSVTVKEKEHGKVKGKVHSKVVSEIRTTP